MNIYRSVAVAWAVLGIFQPGVSAWGAQPWRVNQPSLSLEEVNERALAMVTTWSKRRPTRPVLVSGRPMVIAHRGGSHLFPENTMLAFKSALELGVDVLEMDVRLTADKVFVIVHDDSVNRTTNASGRVGQMTLAQIQSLDAAYWFTTDRGATYPFRGRGVGIPTLREVLKTFPEARVNIEIKDTAPEAVELLVQEIARAGAQNRVIVITSNHDRIARFRTLAPEIATGASLKEVLFERGRNNADVYQVPVRHRGLPLRLDTPEFIEHAHGLNQKVHFWTINDPAEMERLLRIGADGIITDRPDLAIQVIGRLKDSVQEGLILNVAFTRVGGPRGTAE